MGVHRACRSRNPRRFLVVVFEKLAGEGKNFSVTRMVEGFDAFDLGLHRRIMTGDMIKEFGLLVGRPGDQDRASFGEGGDDLMQVFLIFARVAAADGVRLVVNVTRRVVWMYDDDIGVRRVEMEYAGFVMVDPDDSVEMA